MLLKIARSEPTARIFRQMLVLEKLLLLASAEMTG